MPVEIERAGRSPAGPIISDARSPTILATALMIEIVMLAVTVRIPTGVDGATLATVMATLRVLS